MIVPANYPALDIVPPTTSPEVLQWIQEVQNSGVVIPGTAVTQAGGMWFSPLGLHSMALIALRFRLRRAIEFRCCRERKFYRELLVDMRWMLS